MQFLSCTCLSLAFTTNIDIEIHNYLRFKHICLRQHFCPAATHRFCCMLHVGAGRDTSSIMCPRMMIECDLTIIVLLLKQIVERKIDSIACQQIIRTHSFVLSNFSKSRVMTSDDLRQQQDHLILQV